MSVENSLDTHVLVYLFFAAAIEAGCRTLYSEDLQHGQQISGASITNPFGK